MARINIPCASSDVSFLQTLFGPGVYLSTVNTEFRSFPSYFDPTKKNVIFFCMKADIFVGFSAFYGQRSVATAPTNPSHWSIRFKSSPKGRGKEKKKIFRRNS